MSSERVLLLANGTPPSATLIHKRVADCSCLIVVDGAAETAISLGLEPHIVCGDFDSLPEHARTRLSTAEWIQLEDQDMADLEKAVLLAIERGAAEITVLGATGGRMDHTLVNCSMLLHYSRKLSIKLEDDLSSIYAITGQVQFDLVTKPGDTVSLAIFEPSVVSLYGVKWPLKNTSITPGTFAVSNVAIDNRVKLSVEAGNVILCHLPLGGNT